MLGLPKLGRPPSQTAQNAYASVEKPLLGGPFDLVGLVRWVMGDYNRVSKGY